MKYATLILIALSLLVPGSLCGGETPTALKQDAAMLVSAKGAGIDNGTTWESDILDLQFEGGARHQGVLVVKFERFSGTRTNPPHASAVLSIASPTKGVKGIFEISSSSGDAGPDDVRLQEKDGVRSITFTRAIETIERPKPKTRRILDEHFSASFNYELKGDTLVLKGFPKKTIKWSGYIFTTPGNEITFKAVK